jgi:NADP-dependent 3-hydroxy acid dehydrogenase YdfG
MLNSESIARVLTFIASQPEDSDIQDLTIIPFCDGGKDIY